MTVSRHTKAVLLLTMRLTGQSAGPQPLTNAEWARFARWLHEQKRRPEELFDACDDVLADWLDDKRMIDRTRVAQLMDRGSALALALDKWLNAGLWVVTRADAAYPKRLKRRLGWRSPPVLFGCGAKEVLDEGGLAVVGSRDAAPDDLALSRELGESAGGAGVPIVSGGAIGVDEAAMRGAMDAGGRAVGVLAANLLRESARERFRDDLLQGRLALVTPFRPDAGFRTGTAMGRNRYIYCLADAAVVVRSGTSGGTWSGATEALKHGWCPTWIQQDVDPKSANAQLIARGGRPLHGVDAAALTSAPSAEHIADQQMDLF